MASLFIRRAVRAHGGGRAGGRGDGGGAGAWSSGGGACPKDIRIGKLVEAIDVHGIARRRSPGRHRRRRAWPVVSLALEKRLFLNVRRKCLLVSSFGKKSCDINEWHNPF